MKQFLGCEAHKKYSVLVAVNERGEPSQEVRVGHTRPGQACGDVNRYLKWAFVEAGKSVVINQKHLAGQHVVRLYQP